ncbi:MAG TPA: hypothetical protein VLT16_01695 [Candidatus Limnocylindrales bacterium]|nr:hypothetical protein [Candidatus Limnocylindrales bacterium]
MKSSLFSKAIMLVLSLGLAATAFAAGDTHKGNFQISDPVQVNGQQLPAGNYVAKWEGAGPGVQVSITHNGKTVATVPAKVVQLDQKSSEDAAEISNGSSGDRQLSTLRFSGKKYSLELGQSSEARK